MTNIYQDAIAQARAIAESAQEVCPIDDTRSVYQFPKNPFLYVVTVSKATSEELVQPILDQLAVARMQAAEAQAALAMHAGGSMQ